MAQAGADIIVCHMGLTTGGSIGAETALKLDAMPGVDRRLVGGGAGGQAGRADPLPRRPDRRARRTPTTS